MVSIARKNLFHDKGRLAITLIGLAAALLMALFGMGMFVGTLDESVYLVDHVEADIWVLQKGNSEILNPSVIKGDAIKAIDSLPGVESAYEIVYSNALSERGGKKTPVVLTGFALGDNRVRPSSLTDEDSRRLAEPDSVTVDRSMEKKLGVLRVGDRVVIGGEPQKIVGITEGAKWFVNPYVFTSYDNAHRLSRLKDSETTFILVKAKPGFSPGALAESISGLEGVTAFTVPQVRRNTRNWMTFESGMGVGVGSMVVVGLFVAGIIISLMVYTATMERIPEFGTLKALGASRWKVYRVLFEQVLWCVTIGFLIGAALAFGVGRAMSSGTILPMRITVGALLVAYLGSLALALIGAAISVRRVDRVDPAIVFRT